MKEFKVHIPEENYQIINFKQDNLPAVGVINSNLVNFQPKEVFLWHCSIILNFNNFIENGMPDQNDVQIANEFEDFLDKKIKGDDKNKPNALFLGRITWNKTRELIWRVYDAKEVNSLLTNLIELNNYPFEFDFRIDSDDKWKLAEWHLTNCKESTKKGKLNSSIWGKLKAQLKS